MARALHIGDGVTCCGRHLAGTLLCFIFLFLSPSAWAGPVTGAEYAVKAGFIYNFANFVTWPQDAFKNSPGTLVLCLVSDDPQTDVLFKLDGQTVKGKTIKVVAYQGSSCLEKSHILYFATQDRDTIRGILDQVGNRSILTIGEIVDFTAMGGIIDFFMDNNRLRFKVNIDAAHRQGLKMSSQILLSAQIVHGEGK
jgi:hypothetical protein